MIIGFTGTNGAGKTVAAEYLTERGFEFHSLSDEIRSELRRLGEEPTRELLTITGNQLRADHGPAVLAERVRARLDPEHDHVVDSIRNPAEVTVLRSLPGFHLVLIDADPHVRYQRVRHRGGPRRPSSFEEFVEQERREAEGTDPAHQQLRECWRLADETVMNDHRPEDLRASLDRLLESWSKQATRR